MGETTYTPVRDYFKTRNGKAMGADHPIAWTHEPATGSRFFYTAFDHDLRTLSTPFVCQHILKPSSGRVRGRRCVPSRHHKEKPQRETHAHAPPAADRPNIVIFIEDNLSWYDMACFGGPTRARTPNLDRLTEVGMKLNGAYRAYRYHPISRRWACGEISAESEP